MFFPCLHSNFKCDFLKTSIWIIFVTQIEAMAQKLHTKWCVWEISFWPLFDFPVPSHSRATNSFTMWERIKKYSTRVKRMGERVGKSVKARACENNYLIHSRICWVFCSYVVFFFFVCAECLSCYRSVCVRACVCVLYSLHKNTLTLRHKMAYLLLQVVSRTRKT